MTRPTGPMLQQIRDMQNKRHKTLGVLYSLMDQGVEYQNFATRELADLVGYPAATIKAYIQTFEEMGILSRRMEYGNDENKLGTGRHFHWTLMVDRETAFQMLYDEDERGVESYQKNFTKGMANAVKTKKAAQAAAKQPAPAKFTPVPTNPTVTVSITGPDIPSPMTVLQPLRRDESYALVEAARQYRDRDNKIEGRIQALLDQARQLGMSVDEQALRGSLVAADVDPRLETVGLVLPYVEGLERTVANLERMNESLAQKSKDADQMRRDLHVLRDQNQRLIAKSVTN